MAIIELQQVKKVYDIGPEHLEIISGVDAQWSDGSIIIITGESGSGKSTLLNMIGALDSVTEGTIHVAGHPLHSMSEDELTDFRSATVGFIFQFHYLMKDFTARENVMVPAFMRGMNKKDALDKAAELLTAVGMENRLDHFPSQLSGGERQRVAVARSLINDPPVVLADEPTGNLDERNSRKVEEILFQLVRSVGKTLVLVTHDNHLKEYGDQSFILEDGRLCEG
ncbi:MAG: ABC transporter ATP-binding protein [Spirochaetales bacterium]|nr:ABC transporter ATP-binding protein [Spirochaetales bacterium]